MFPGQGSQYAGMGKAWADNFKEAKLAFEEASDACSLPLAKLCFEGSEEDLKRTENTQPAILTTTVAVYRSLLACTGLSGHLKSAIFGGHSLGEFSALVCAGALPLGPAAQIVRHRGAYMQEAVPAGTGGMAALIFKPKTSGHWPKVEAACAAVRAATGKVVSPANDNAPEQIVIAGHKVAVAEAMKKCSEESVGARRAIELPVSAPFHCELMKPAAERLAPELRAASWQKTDASYIANVDATLHPLGDSQAVVERLVRQITAPVHWVRSVEAAHTQGARRFIEIGPGAVLAGLARKILGEREATISNVDRWEDFSSHAETFI